jgi:hypothetical protein
MTDMTPSSELPMPRLTTLLAEVPEWDKAAIPPVQPEFTRYLADHDIPFISAARLPDQGISVNRYALVRPTDALGRYQVEIFYPDPLASDAWFPGPPRPRMDIRAALELAARLVAESA